MQCGATVDGWDVDLPLECTSHAVGKFLIPGEDDLGYRDLVYPLCVQHMKYGIWVGDAVE